MNDVKKNPFEVCHSNSWHCGTDKKIWIHHKNLLYEVSHYNKLIISTLTSSRVDFFQSQTLKKKTKHDIKKSGPECSNLSHKKQ